MSQAIAEFGDGCYMFPVWIGVQAVQAMAQLVGSVQVLFRFHFGSLSANTVTETGF